MEALQSVLGVINIYNVLFLVAEVFCVIIGGALPGISPSMTIALLFPMSLYLPPSYAIMMLVGAYQGAMYGGLISSVILICLAENLATVSLQFGPAEYFGIMLLALTLIAGVCGANLLDVRTYDADQTGRCKTKCSH